MKKTKFSEGQIAFILRQAEEGTAVAEVCRKAGIAEATFYNWRKKYGGLMPSEMKRLKQGRSRAGDMAGEHSPGLPRPAGGAIDLSLPLPAARAGRA